MPDYCSRHKERTVEIYVHHALPGFGFNVPKVSIPASDVAFRALVDPSVVDKDVDATKVADRPSYSGRYRFRLRNVQIDGDRAAVAADRAHLVHTFLEPGLVDVTEGNSGTGAYQCVGHSMAKSDWASGTGNNRDFACKWCAHNVISIRAVSEFTCSGAEVSPHPGECPKRSAGARGFQWIS